MRNPSAFGRRRSSTRNPLPVTKITASRFRELRLSCALAVPDAAKVLHVTERTVHNWEAGATRVPYAAYKLLRILRGYELPGRAWRGWMLIRDELISPEGRSFKASEAAWWGLLIARARMFDNLVQVNKARSSVLGVQP